MGKVEAFTLQGLHTWFNSSDHLPPHIHVKRRGAWEIRAILDAVLKHREALLLEWERKVCTSN